ncbi:nucleotidyltransferase family protein [Croceicoccus sp. F390]|uniref:Nucleotidyltransferase family protein n=1 Tax=Croceicoccus esteveae TaxID=3075597 RepID=A0ABU2ZHA9_9SPHN|nr:nucleotidyltransferase family protein [Croceicoccus sp. F390]MDT0575448.1 nucleotidyltransferase family protein [Croceicoccus sp. F390]
MSDVLPVLAVTLAAGKASRFGADKLAACINGTSVLENGLRLLDRFRFHRRIIVLDPVRAAGFARPDTQVIVNDAPDAGIGHSIALAATVAQKVQIEAMLVTLGDMPCVSFGTLAAILSAPRSWHCAIVATRSGDAPPGPPALFGRDWFALLAQCTGDTGAGAILRNPVNQAISINASPSETADIDTPADLLAVRRHAHGQDPLRQDP